MTILFLTHDPREAILARYDDELRMASAASSKAVQKAHRDRADAYRASLSFVDNYFQCLPTHEPQALRDLDEIRNDVVGGGIVRG